MIEMRGLSNSYINFEDGKLDRPKMSPLYFCDARTLGEALEKYCEEFRSSVRPYAVDPPLPPYTSGTRMAIVYDDPQSRFREVVAAVSIEREGKVIEGCYGFDFPLMPGDEIDFGVAGC